MVGKRNKRAHLKQGATGSSDKSDKTTPNKPAKSERKQQIVLKGDEPRGPGCNVPYLRGGCLVGKPIPAGASKLPDGAVKMRCQNQECPAVPWIHAECYDKLEDLLSDLCLSSSNRSNKWSKKFAVENLWKQKRGYDLIYRHMACSAQGCGGKLNRDFDVDPVGAPPALPKAVPRPAPKPAPKPKPKPYAYYDLEAEDREEMEARKQTKSEAKKARPDLEAMLKPNGYSGCLHSTAGKGSNGSSYIKRIDNVQNHIRRHVARDRLEEEKVVPVGAPGWAKQREAEALEAGVPSHSAWGRDAVPSKVVPTVPPPSAFPTLVEPAPTPLDRAWGFAPSKELRPKTNLSAPAANFLKELESLVRIGNGRLWELDPLAEDLFTRMDHSLVVDMADAGGPKAWLANVDASVQLQDGSFIVVGMVQRRHGLRGTGIVESICDPTQLRSSEVILFSESHETRLLVDRSSQVTEGDCLPLKSPLSVGDWLQFEAEIVGEGEPGLASQLGLKWKVVSAQLLQRKENDQSSHHYPGAAILEAELDEWGEEEVEDEEEVDEVEVDEVEEEVAPLAMGGASLDYADRFHGSGYPIDSSPIGTSPPIPDYAASNTSLLRKIVDHHPPPNPPPYSHPTLTPPSQPSNGQSVSGYGSAKMKTTNFMNTPILKPTLSPPQQLHPPPAALPVQSPSSQSIALNPPLPANEPVVKQISFGRGRGPQMGKPLNCGRVSVGGVSEERMGGLGRGLVGGRTGGAGAVGRDGEAVYNPARTGEESLPCQPMGNPVAVAGSALLAYPAPRFAGPRKELLFHGAPSGVRAPVARFGPPAPLRPPTPTHPSPAHHLPMPGPKLQGFGAPLSGAVPLSGRRGAEIPTARVKPGAYVPHSSSSNPSSHSVSPDGAKETEISEEYLSRLLQNHVLH